MRTLCTSALAGILLAALCAVAAGQEAAVQTISEVNSLLRTQSTEAARRVVFHGVVNHRSTQLRGVFIQDESGGVFVWPPRGVENPALGSEIEAVADVRYANPSIDTEVQALSIRVLGQPGLSTPLDATMPDLVAGKHNRLAVSVEGRVLQAQEGTGLFKGVQWLLVANATGACMGGVYSWPDGWSAETLVGKNVRLRGVSAGVGPNSLRCSSPEEITVLDTLTEPPAVLGSVAEVLALGPDVARFRRWPCSVHGVCTYANSLRNFFILQDGSAAMGVYVKGPEMCPPFGSEVAVSGVTTGDADGASAEGWAVRSKAGGTLPEPVATSLNGVSAALLKRRWVQTEGVVIEVRSNPKTGAMHLHLADAGGSALVKLQRPPAGCDPAAMFGARVRICGVAGPAQVFIELADSGQSFTLLSPGHRDAFAPLDVTAPPGLTLRHGTVLDARDGWIYARDAAGAFRIQMLAPFAPGEKDWSVASAPASIPQLTTGDEADFVGVAAPRTVLLAQARITGRGRTVESVPGALVGATDGTLSSELVTLHGRLKEYTSSSITGSGSTNRWREGLRLVQNGVELEAVLEQPSSQSKLAVFKPDDRLEVTGIVRTEEGTPPFRLVLRTASDVRSLGIAPEVLRERNVRLFAITGAATALALGLIFLMARKLANARLLAAERDRADAAVRAMNTELEKHVAQRTAELEATQAELRLALANERELGNLKTSFVSLVSHEFRTPLNVIVTSSDILARYLDRLPESERAEHLASIQESVKRMSGMMEDVLLLGRFESGMQKFNPEELHLAAWSRRFVDEMQSATGARCPLHLEVGEFPAIVLADESLLRHILANLVANAAKYSDPGTPVKINITREGGDAVFRVEDHGIGIPEADRTRLFDAFHRGGNVGQISGTGLGLVVVKRGVAMHGGTLDFTSQPGVGTIFTVRLPLFSPAT